MPTEAPSSEVAPLDRSPASPSPTPDQVGADYVPLLIGALGLAPGNTPVQAKGELGGSAVRERASAGVAGPGGALPFRSTIESSFGGIDLGGVTAHVGGAAGEAARGLGAAAYASGDRVAFAQAPDLHTAAHEAAHVVQQRAGLAPAGGVGKAGDDFERNADAVADRVVAGRSAADLLPGNAGGRATAVQLKPESKDGDVDAAGPTGTKLGSITIEASLIGQLAMHIAGLSGKTATLRAFYVSGSIELWVLDESGTDHHVPFELDVAHLVAQVRDAVSEAYADALERLREAGEKASSFTKRVELRDDGLLAFYLGKSSDRKSQLVGFSVADLVGAIGKDGFTLRPAEVRLGAGAAELDLQTRSDAASLDLRGDLGAEHRVGSLDVSEEVGASGLAGLLRVDETSKVELSAYWDGKGRQVGLTVISRGAKAAGIGGAIDVGSIQDRLEALVESLGDRAKAWLKERKKGSKSWLAKALAKFDGPSLVLEIGGSRIGFDLMAQLRKIANAAGRIDLSGLVPDFFDIDLGDFGFRVGRQASADGGETGGFVDSLGFLRGIELPGSIRGLLDLEGLDVIPSAIDIELGVLDPRNLGLRFDLGFDGMDLPTFMPTIDVVAMLEKVRPMVDRALAAITGKVPPLLEALRDSASLDLEKLLEIDGGVQLRLRPPGVLQIIHGDDVVGFDLLGFIAEPSMANIIPLELDIGAGPVDITVGAITDDGNGAVVAYAPEGEMVASAPVGKGPALLDSLLRVDEEAGYFVRVYDSGSKVSLWICEYSAEAEQALSFGFRYKALRDQINQHASEIFERLADTGATIPEIDDKWKLSFATEEAAAVGGVALRVGQPDGPSFVVGWSTEDLVRGIESIDALFPPSLVKAENLFNGAVGVETGVPIPKGKPDAELAGRRIWVDIDGETIVITSAAEGASTAEKLTLHMGNVIEWVQGSLGSALDPVLERFDVIGGGVAKLKKRFVVEGGKLRVHLGPSSNPKKHFVGFDLGAIVEAGSTGSIDGLHPVEARIDIDGVGSLELGERPKGDKPEAPVQPSVGTTDAVEAVDMVAGMLGLDIGLKPKLEMAVGWNGDALGFAVSSPESTRHLEATIEVAELAERLEGVLSRISERVAQWLQGEKESSGSSWLAKAKVPKLSGDLFRFELGGHSFGFHLGNQLSALFAGGGLDLAGLVPDFFDFDFELGSFSFGHETDAVGSLIGFTEIGSANFTLPTFLTDLLGSLPGVSKLPKTASFGAFWRAGSLGLELSLSAAQLGASEGRSFATSFSFANVIERVRGMLPDRTSGIGKWLERLGNKKEDPKTVAPDEAIGDKVESGVKLGMDGVLRFFHGDNQIGFDLTEVIDGFDVSDLVPVELHLSTAAKDDELPGIEVQYGHAGMPDTPPHERGEAVVVPRPDGDPVAEHIGKAPEWLADQLGVSAESGGLYVAVFTTDGAERYTLFAAIGQRALRIDIAAEPIRELATERIGKLSSGKKKLGGPSLTIDRDRSAGLPGLVVSLAIDAGTVRVGYGLERLIGAFRSFDLLQLPDFVQVETKHGLRIGYGSAMTKPAWVEGTEPVLDDFDPPALIEKLVGKKAPIDVYAQRDGAMGIDMYAAFDPSAGVEVAGEPLGGVSLQVPSELVQGMVDRLGTLIAKAQSALTSDKRDTMGEAVADSKRRLAVEVDFEGGLGLSVRVGKASGRVRYSYGQILRLAGGAVELDALIPDDIAVETEHLSLAVHDGKVPGADDAEAHPVADMPGLLKDAFGLAGITSGTIKLVTPEAGVIDEGGRVNISVVHEDAKDTTSYSLKVSLAAILDALMPRGVTQKMQQKASGKGANKVGYELDQGPPARINVWYARKKKKGAGEAVRIEAGWTVAQLMEILLELDRVVDEPGLVTPDHMTVSINGKKFGVELGVSQSAMDMPETKLTQEDFELLPGLDGMLAEALGEERAAGLEVGIETPDVEAIKSASKAVFAEGMLPLAKMVVKLPSASKDPDIDADTNALFFSGKLKVTAAILAKLARLFPGIGMYVALAEQAMAILEDPESAVYAPMVMTDIIASLPESIKAYADLDWENTDWASVAKNLMVLDLPNFKELHNAFVAAKKLRDAGFEFPPDRTLDEVFSKANDKIAFAQALSQMSTDQIRRLLEHCAAHKGSGDAQQKKTLSDLAAQAGQMEGLSRFAEAAAVGHATEEVGGDGGRAMDEAYDQAKTSADGGGPAGVDVDDAVRAELEARLKEEPFKSFIHLHQRGDESPTAFQLRIDRTVKWLAKYGPMTADQLRGELRNLVDTGGAVEEKVFVANLLLYRITGSVGGDRATPERVEQAIASILDKADEELLADSDRRVQAERDRTAEREAHERGIDIDFDKAAEKNPKYAGKYGYDGDGLGMQGPVEGSAFAVDVAKRQEQLGIGVDGMAGPGTLRAHFEELGETDNPIYVAAGGKSSGVLPPPSKKPMEDVDPTAFDPGGASAGGAEEGFLTGEHMIALVVIHQRGGETMIDIEPSVLKMMREEQRYFWRGDLWRLDKVLITDTVNADPSNVYVTVRLDVRGVGTSNSGAVEELFETFHVAVDATGTEAEGIQQWNIAGHNELAGLVSVPADGVPRLEEDGEFKFGATGSIRVLKTAQGELLEQDGRKWALFSWVQVQFKGECQYPAVDGEIQWLKKGETRTRHLPEGWLIELS